MLLYLRGGKLDQIERTVAGPISLASKCYNILELSSIEIAGTRALG